MATKAKSKSSGKKPATSKAKASPQPQRRPVRREIWAAVCFFIGLFSFIGYFKVDALFITYFCKFIKGLIGYGYFIFPPALLACAAILAFHKGKPVRLRAICMAVLPLVFGSLVQVLFCKLELDFSKFGVLLSTLYSSGQDLVCGGVISGLLGMGFEAMFSVYGAVPVFFFAFVVLIMIAFKISPSKIAEKVKQHERIEYVPEPDEPAETQRASGRTRPEAKAVKHAIDIPMDDEPSEEYEEKKVGFFNVNPRVKTPDKVLSKVLPAETIEQQSQDVEPEPVAADEPAAVPDDIKTEEVVSEILAKPKAAPKRALDASDLQSATDEVAKAVEQKDSALKPEYNYPPIDLLRKGGLSGPDGREEMALNRDRLQSTLDSFGVNATITEITRGPTVTRYDLELEAGVKLTKLTNLAGDLALSLGVTGVRIAPIPDKISTVGVEVPNKIVSMVYLRDIIGSDTFKNSPSKLTFAIGEDIGGNSICGNIAKLPHMLIAGTTGSGKSVCMNSLILSLLFKAKPEEVRLIMIDPKMVELGIYNGIPHLYIPVVTDPKKAAGSLQWAVVEMMKRYRIFSEAGVRDISSYNNIMRNEGQEILPQVVIVIDELADLMLVASKEVEESICRVAQMGRASGMHLVIATQRPSADVITGLMKANIPSRIAFAVSSAMESRIILDQSGAEKLVGSGDMLYAPLGVGKPKRIQGAFVSDDEREKVVNFVKQNSEANYSEDIMAQIEKAAEDKATGSSKQAESVTDGADKSSYDELLPQAVDVIFETKQASVSMLQRRLKLGYARAARIVDQMEEIGVVGPFEGSKPRQILITREQWQEMQLMNGTAPLETIPEQLDFSDYEDSDEDKWEIQ